MKKRDFETYHKRFRDFEILTKFSETHVFRGTIRQPSMWRYHRSLFIFIDLSLYCWFSHDVTKSQTMKLSILLRFYFHGVLEQLKTNFQTNFCFKRVLGFVIKHA